MHIIYKIIFYNKLIVTYKISKYSLNILFWPLGQAVH